MNFRMNKKKVLLLLSAAMLVTGGLALFAFARTINKTELEFRIHINEKLVRVSTFGESPTFAIWLEDPSTGKVKTIFVTSRAGLGDWEGKAAVPVALPKWFEINKTENQATENSGSKETQQLAITGATPKPGYFDTRVRITPGSRWICWIEVNLAGDFNETYPEYDEVKKTSDEFKTGQPALLYKAEIEAVIGNHVKPEIAGIIMLDSAGKAIVEPPAGITTASGIFDEINISVVKPKPRIIEW
jgi:hypothetical protein